jgi:cystathionine beta-lyase
MVRTATHILNDNAEFIGDFVRDNMPNVRYTKPEGTYLAWLDLRELKVTMKY